MRKNHSRKKDYNKKKDHSRKKKSTEKIYLKYINKNKTKVTEKKSQIKENFIFKKNEDVCEYTLNNIKIINNSRIGKINNIKFPAFKEENEIYENDWYPSYPYSVYIDNMIFCANIKITKDYVHFHLVCGYNPENEYQGADETFSKLRKHLIIKKNKVKFLLNNGKRYYLVKTVPSDWDKLYVLGENESKHFWDKYKNPWDAYQWYVDWLLNSNKKKLAEYNRTDSIVERTAGERIVSDFLKRLNLRYIPEYIIENLYSDKSKYRVADFYLPKEDIYIEVNGGLNTINIDKRENEILRYAEKKEVYEKNKLRFIYIFPADLSHGEYILALAIADLIKDGKISDKTKKLQNINNNTSESDIALRYKRENDDLKIKIENFYNILVKMEEKTLAFKISKPFKEIKKSVSEKILGTKKGHVHQSKQSTETKLINLIEEREELENKLKDIENQLNKIQNTPMNKVKKTFNEIFNKK